MPKSASVQRVPQLRIDIQDYWDKEVCLNFSSDADSAWEMRIAKAEGPEIEFADGTRRRVRTGDIVDVWDAHTSKVVQCRVKLSGFGPLDRAPGEKRQLTSRQKYAIRVKERNLDPSAPLDDLHPSTEGLRPRPTGRSDYEYE